MYGQIPNEYRILKLIYPKTMDRFIRIGFVYYRFSPSESIVYVYLGPTNLYSIIIIISFHLFIYILYILHQTLHSTLISHSASLLLFFSIVVDVESFRCGEWSGKWCSLYACLRWDNASTSPGIYLPNRIAKCFCCYCVLRWVCVFVVFK